MAFPIPFPLINILNKHRTTRLKNTKQHVPILYDLKVSQTLINRANKFISYLDKMKTNLQKNPNCSYTQNVIFNKINKI